MSRPLQGIGHALRIVDPALALAAAERVELEADTAPEVGRVDHHAVVGPALAQHAYLAVDRHREHKAVIIVGVLADEVDTARRPRHEHVAFAARERLAEQRHQIGHRIAVRDCRPARAHGRSSTPTTAACSSVAFPSGSVSSMKLPPPTCMGSSS